MHHDGHWLRWHLRFEPRGRRTLNPIEGFETAPIKKYVNGGFYDTVGKKYLKKAEIAMHKIKKYINRKMYDSTDKKYVSMAQLAKLIKSGEEVSIIDNKTGEDLTAAIVSRLIGQEKKEKGSVVSPRIMMQLLRKGGDTLTDYAKKYTSLWQNALTMAEDEVDKLVGTLVNNKELSRSEGSRLKQEITGYTDSLKSWIGERVDRRISEALNAMNLAPRDQVEALAAKIEKLGKEVARLKKSTAAAKSGQAGGAKKKSAKR